MNMSAGGTWVVKGRYAYLAGLVLLYMFSRFLVLFCAIDKVTLDEELYRGNIAKELISGPAFPFFDYQRSEYEGGSLVNGVLAVPFFLLFGERLVTLKLVGLLIGTGSFILLYLFLDRFFNRKVAVWTSLLFILLPSLWIKLSISSYGMHYEVSFFTLLAILIFYQIFFVSYKKYLFGLLGIICGFGLFYHYSFFATLVTIVLFWFIFDKKFFLKREFLIFTTTFLAGFAPWIWYNITHNFQGLIVCDQPISYWLAHNGPLRSLLRIKDFLTRDVADAFSFEDPFLKFEPQALLGNWLLSRIYYFAFMFCFCALTWINRRSLVQIIRRVIFPRSFTIPPKSISKETFLLVLFTAFILIFGMSGIQPNSNYYEGSVLRYRHVGPICLFVPALIVIFLYGERTKFSNFFIPYFRSCIMALLLALGMISYLNFISKGCLDKAKLAGMWRGYNYYDVGRVIAWRFDGSFKWIELIKGIKDAEARRYCYSGMGWGYAEDKFGKDYHYYLGTLISKIERSFWPYAYEWMGEALEREFRYDKSTDTELKSSLAPEMISYFYNGVGREAVGEVGDNPEQALMSFKKRIDEEYMPFFYKGIGIELFDILTDQPDKFFRFMNAIDRKFEPIAYAGLAEGKEYYRTIYNFFGCGIGKVGYNFDAWKRIIGGVKEEYKPLCYQRLGIEVGWRFIHDITKYIAFLRGADQKYLTYLYKGLGTGIAWRFAYDLRGCVTLIQYVDQVFWPYVYEGLGIGVARRYDYHKEAWAKGSENIPLAYRSYFEAGIKNDFDRRYGRGN